MLSFGHVDRSQFGGIGVMIDPPAVEVTITPATQFHASGDLAGRVRHFVDRVVSRWGLDGLPHCTIRADSPPDHVGLGVGTQLGLSVAAGLRRFLRLPELAAEALAPDVGRGVRSAVGTHGFQHGGLIVETGHTVDEPLGFLVKQMPVPDSWRFVLVRPPSERGLAGAGELDAFGRLPPVPHDVSKRLVDIALGEMLPALEQHDCSGFGHAVYRFGHLAGECFAPVQGGPFASGEIAHVIQLIRDWSIAGVGQSSWGPTVFAICCSESDAQSLCDRLQAKSELHGFSLEIASPCNHGARISVHGD
jgi:beta-RFAP synthase